MIKAAGGQAYSGVSARPRLARDPAGVRRDDYAADGGETT
jgi:hypothetical protein